MKKLLIIILSFILFTCKEPYISPVSSPNLGYLVVEGVINSGAGNTTIRLSRTTQLSDGRRVTEAGALVSLQNENGGNLFFAEVNPGEYQANDLNLDVNQKYRLRIASNGREYISDCGGVNSNPPVDSVSWTNESDGLHLFVNTHDPQSLAKYFLWDFTETWEFHSDWAPNCKYNAPNDPYWVTYEDQVIYYKRDSSRWRCFRSDTSTQILIGSSVKYAIDTISSPLRVIESGSQKLSVLYSINVRQFSLSKDAFEFMEKMKKNSEQLGGVFDAQPTELQGNIHQTSNPNEIVIGFVSICPSQEKRIFLTADEVGGWNYSSGCYLITEDNNRDYIKMNNFARDSVTPIILPVEYRDRNPSDPPPNGYIINFVAAEARCVDCTLNGTTVKPSFWP